MYSFFFITLQHPIGADASKRRNPALNRTDARKRLLLLQSVI